MSIDVEYLANLLVATFLLGDNCFNPAHHYLRVDNSTGFEKPE